MDAAVVDRTFIRVSGPDAEAYLQGQLSQDVAPGGGLSFLLDPSGKVVSFLRFVRLAGDFLLDTDPAAGDATLARLRRFLLRTKATVETEPGLGLLRVFDGPPLPQAQIVTAWSPTEASVQDLVGPDAAAELATIGAERLEPAEYHRRRILAGVPIAGVDIGADTIPAEAGRWAIEAGVSFTKGCYTGQELVARIDSRGGNVPRPLRAMQLDAPVEPGEEVRDGGGEVVGVVTSAAVDVAMGPIARRIEPGADVVVGAVHGVVL